MKSFALALLTLILLTLPAAAQWHSSRTVRASSVSSWSGTRTTSTYRATARTRTYSRPWVPLGGRLAIILSRR